MANDLNVWIGIGRLTKDASLTYTSSGTATCKFDIAVNRKKKSGEKYVDEVSFFTVVLWGKAGESLNQYLTKGKQVAVEGELRQDRWEQDGQSRSKVEIMADNVQLLGGGQDARGGAQSSQAGESRQAPRQASPAAQGKPPTKHTERTDPDDGFADDIPF